MKKTILLAIIVTSCTICSAQQPTRTKTTKTLSTRTTDQADLEKMKTEITQLLLQYNKQMNAAQETMNKIQQKQNALTTAMKDLESQDKLGNFEIQDLMSKYNQSVQLASSVLKKASDTKDAVIRKIN